MKTQDSFHVIQLPESVFWVRDKNRIVVIDIEKPYTQALHGLEAAIWGWLTLGYSYPRLLKLVTTALEVHPETAENSLLETLNTWIAAGILEVHGEMN